MKTSIDTLQEESKKMALDEAERQAMRESLLSYIEKNPIRESAGESSDSSPKWGMTKTNWVLIILIIVLIASVLRILLK
jgi:hypothetical protein